jgi:hypothetical protein
MLSRLRNLGVALAVPCVFTLAVSAAAQSAQAPAAPKPAATAALPAAQSVIDRHIEASGGRKALAARQSVRAVGTISLPANGISGTMEMYTARPNRQFVKSTLAGVGEILEGFDGTNGWSINPMTGPMVLTGEELKQRAFDADFDGQLNAASRYAEIKTLEKTTFDGRECYKLSLTRKDGGEDIHFYDAKTGLLAGSIGTRKTSMGPITSTTTVSEYKKFDDLVLPTVTKLSAQGMEIVTTFTTYEFDKVDPSVFEPPAQIKALIK